MSAGEYGRGDGTGRLLAGRYRVTAQLGRGGMGVVWKAVDEVLGREVAVKELRTYTDAAGPELADLGLRMQREARAAARVRHPGVIAVHDIAETDGRPLIVMELIDGPSLDDVLRDRGTLDPREAADIGAKVMDALAAAHRAGVLHRDVKPGNILLDRSGRTVLTDFGIATMDDPGDGAATHLTRSGEIVGSLDYLAPERAQGAVPGPASDVWALGATLYAAVEGSSPFRRTSTFSTLTAIVSEPLPDSGRTGPLAPVLGRLMDKRPEARPEAAEARVLLEAVAAGADTPTTSLRRPTPVPAPVRTETERSVPAVPPGFGPPERPTRPEAPGGPVPGAHAVPEAGSPPTGPMDSAARSRRKGRALLAAVAVTVVLAAAGITAAVFDSSDGTRADAHTGGTRTDAPASPTPSGDTDATRPPGPGADAERSAAPSEKSDEKDGTEDTPTGRPATSAAEKTPDRGTSGGDDSDDAPGGDGGATTAAPVCDPVGAGKYNCQVWRTATSYTASGTEAGLLNAGTNYFYCQQNLGRRETHGEWTNTWWARTDDDSGNTGVWVSDVYIRGGANDAPVPGLPYC